MVPTYGEKTQGSLVCRWIEGGSLMGFKYEGEDIIHLPFIFPGRFPLVRRIRKAFRLLWKALMAVRTGRALIRGRHPHARGHL